MSYDNFLNLLLLLIFLQSTFLKLAGPQLVQVKF